MDDPSGPPFPWPHTRIGCPPKRVNSSSPKPCQSFVTSTTRTTGAESTHNSTKVNQFTPYAKTRQPRRDPPTQERRPRRTRRVPHPHHQRGHSLEHQLHRQRNRSHYPNRHNNPRPQHCPAVTSEPHPHQLWPTRLQHTQTATHRDSPTATSPTRPQHFGHLTARPQRGSFGACTPLAWLGGPLPLPHRGPSCDVARGPIRLLG